MARHWSVPFLLAAFAGLAGCSGGGEAGTDSAPDPFAGECDYPSVTQVGSNAYLVGGVADEATGERLQGVHVHAEPVEGDSVSTSQSSEGGCYFLGLEPGMEYEVAWTHPGHRDHRMEGVVVEPGEKRIEHVLMRAA